MRKAFTKVNEIAVKGYCKGRTMLARTRGILTQKDAEGFVDTALKILISVVIGALLLAGLYLLFKDTVLPILTSKIKQLFDYTG